MNSLLDQPENYGQREAANIDQSACNRIAQARHAEWKKLGAPPMGEKAIEKWQAKSDKLDAKYPHERGNPWRNVATLERLGLDAELATRLRGRLARL